MKEARILVIDDDRVLSSALRQTLRDEGYDVVGVADGQLGLAAARTLPPDVILLDLMMPGMNGRQFLRELRTIDFLASVPVLVITGLQGINTDLNDFGVTDVLEQPFGAEDLLSKVALAVFRSRSDWSDQRPAVDIKNDRNKRLEQASNLVLLVEPDRAALAKHEATLVGQGFTVVAIPRSVVALSRLCTALVPAVVVVGEGSEHVEQTRDLDKSVAALVITKATKENELLASVSSLLGL